MCGGLVLSVSRSQTSLWVYHLGRLAGYFALGSIAGLLGKHAFHSSLFMIFPWVASAALALGFVLTGVQLWRGRSLHLFRLPTPFYSRFQKTFGSGPLSTGLLTAFLPCGWLHTFVLGAMTTGSPWAGGAYLALFWLGTLPALSLAPMAVTPLLKRLALGSPKISGLLLICFGFLSIAVRLLPHGSHSGCH